MLNRVPKNLIMGPALVKHFSTALSCLLEFVSPPGTQVASEILGFPPELTRLFPIYVHVWLDVDSGSLQL